ncbi:hypothetical protein FDECE_5723 [Fusarium decemcellulare]|nr:hypothetical protein FDECE_5723 [Fusarium decemcellulare]
MASTSSGYVSYGQPGGVPQQRTTTQPATNYASSRLNPVPARDVEHAKLPPLDFRPTILTGGALFLSLVFHLLVLGTLVFLYYKEIFSVSYAWAYFVIKILPTVIGTATAVLVDEMGQSLSRIRPFMLCAQEEGCTADKTILMSYFPMPDFTTLWKSRNWLLLVSKALSFINYFTIGLKTSFLLTPDYQNAEVVPWAVLSLVGLYAAVSLYLIAVFFSLHGKVTGLRWDPVSVADQLVLFRHSDFLDMFEGTWAADRTAIENHLGDLRLRIGYWDTGFGYWHGFGLADPSQTQHRRQQVADNYTKSVDKVTISSYRYSSASAAIEPKRVWLFTFATSLLLAGALLMIVYGSKQEEPYLFDWSLDYNHAVSVFVTTLTILIGLYTDFWEALAGFTAVTEPFVHMSSETGTDAPNADKTLLLNYTSLSFFVKLHTAFGMDHWKVFRTAIMARLQRFLPILVAGSFTIFDNGNLEISFPFFVVISAWLSVYLLWIPFETLGCDDSRYLPRYFGSLADLLSWTYSSSLLRGNLSGNTQASSNGQDPLEIRFPKNGHQATAGLQNGGFANGGTNSQRTSQWTPSEKQHVESRLRLSDTRFHFGLCSLGPSLYTVGVCDSASFQEKVLERPKHRLGWFQCLWPTTRFKRNQGSDDGTGYRMAGWQRFIDGQGSGENESIPLGPPPNPVVQQEDQQPDTDQ